MQGLPTPPDSRASVASSTPHSLAAVKTIVNPNDTSASTFSQIPDLGCLIMETLPQMFQEETHRKLATVEEIKHLRAENQTVKTLCDSLKEELARMTQDTVKLQEELSAKSRESDEWALQAKECQALLAEAQSKISGIAKIVEASDQSDRNSEQVRDTRMLIRIPPLPINNSESSSAYGPPYRTSANDQSAYFSHDGCRRRCENWHFPFHLFAFLLLLNELASLSSPMSKTPLTIHVVDALDWPPLQDYHINTPGSLFPRSVKDGDDGFRLTPNGPSDWNVDSRTPSSSHTFGFPLSPRSPQLRSRRKSAALSTHLLPPKTPFEKQKHRLRRYTAAETQLARISDPVSPSPAELYASALKFSVRSLALRIFEAQQMLREVTREKRQDTARWMVEHHVADLELLQGNLKTELNHGSRSKVQPDDDQNDTNLVRFLGSAKVVPVFTRRVRRPQPQNRILAASMVESRRMASSSPMQLQTQSSSLPRHDPRSEWSWETRIRTVLLYPNPKPPQLPLSSVESNLNISNSSRSTTETSTSSFWTTTPTSETFNFSPIDEIPDPDTPLSELNDIFEEDEDEDMYEDYPTFNHNSAYSRPWKPSVPVPTAKPAAPPPLATNFSPDVTYGWLADPSTWTSPSTWQGDGWEVSSPSSSHSRSSSLLEPLSASTISPSSPYQYGYPGYSQTPYSAATAPNPRTPTRDRSQSSSSPSQSRSSFWASIPGRHRRLQSLKPVSAAERESYAVKPLPPAPGQTATQLSTPITPQSAPLLGFGTSSHRKEKDKEKGLSFIAGLVRKATLSSHNRVDDVAEPSPTLSDTSSVFSFGMGQNKLRKQRSGLRRMSSQRSLTTASIV
ncbi:hypothetical protein MIND_00214300 [Mycena indigotica]|uniref:Uncharacterized protein n=1 Tax=Mycena indigotica TaxID=2126181 RepID=A0A8H6T6L6_9AGAR|nr:uncharacterized protein MIND_00214300 [Mycena indigotica]KAF7312023.1 hypothetical protein MIND_00214300 [Mycena indigotica]